MARNHNPDKTKINKAILISKVYVNFVFSNFFSMKDIVSKLKISNGNGFSLKNFDPGYSADLKKEDAAIILADLVKEISELQPKLYADRRYALLILFQAMDAGGKDSAIAHTMSGLNPQGCEVHSFKQPGA